MIDETTELYRVCDLPAFDQDAHYNCEEVHDGQSGFHISLRNRSGKTTTLLWRDNVLSYRKTEESDRIKLMDQMDKVGILGKKLIFIENSHYISWLKEQNYITDFSGIQLRHFAVLSSNDIIEVIDYDEPEIINR